MTPILRMSRDRSLACWKVKETFSAAIQADNILETSTVGAKAQSSLLVSDRRLPSSETRLASSFSNKAWKATSGFLQDDQAVTRSTQRRLTLAGSLSIGLRLSEHLYAS